MNQKSLNAKYALVNIGYMLLASGSVGFAFNYLTEVGFEAGTIGTTMSVMSLIGVFLGPAAGDLVDRSEKLTQKLFIAGSMVVAAIFGLLLLFVPAGSIVILPLVVVAFSCCMVGVPMVNSMAFIYEKAGGVINYGLCRGLGSAAYAVGANMVGRLWAILGARTLPIVIVVGSLFTLCAALIMPPEPNDEVVDTEAPAEKPASISIWQFFGRYSKVVPIICALVLLYFCHNVVNTYMGAILANIMVGATDAQVAEVQGNALFIQAMVELPIMFGFVFIMRKLTINQILVISAVFYSLKHIIILLAPSVPMFYAAMVLQMFSYAAIAPAVVYFCNEQVAAEDQNKGQAIFLTSNSVGSLLASFVGGWLFQLLGVQVGLTIGVGASIVGTVLMVFGCGRLGLARKAA